MARHLIFLLVFINIYYSSEGEEYDKCYRDVDNEYRKLFDLMKPLLNTTKVDKGSAFPEIRDLLDRAIKINNILKESIKKTENINATTSDNNKILSELQKEIKRVKEQLFTYHKAVTLIKDRLADVASRSSAKKNSDQICKAVKTKFEKIKSDITFLELLDFLKKGDVPDKLTKDNLDISNSIKKIRNIGFRMRKEQNESINMMKIIQNIQIPLSKCNSVLETTIDDILNFVRSNKELIEQQIKDVKSNINNVIDNYQREIKEFKKELNEFKNVLKNKKSQLADLEIKLNMARINKDLMDKLFSDQIIQNREEELTLLKNISLEEVTSQYKQLKKVFEEFENVNCNITQTFENI